MINYKAIQRKKLLNDEVKWYPAIVLGNPVLLDEMTELIALNCTVTEHDIKAVLSALQEQIVLALKQGRSVRLGDLGSFRLTMSGRGEESAEKVTEQSIESLRVQFRASGDMNDALQVKARGISFHKVKESEEQETETPSEPSDDGNEGGEL